MLESVYEAVLAHSLEKRGLAVDRQKLIAIHFDGLIVEGGFRADIIVENKLLSEVKSIDRLAPVLTSSFPSRIFVSFA